MDKIPLGNLIKSIRLQRGLSMSQLARLTGHSVSTIHGIESGANLNPRFKIICDISDELNICLDDFKEQCK